MAVKQLRSLAKNTRGTWPWCVCLGAKQALPLPFFSITLPERAVKEVGKPLLSASVVLWNRHAQAGKSPGLKLCHLLHVKEKSYLQRSHPSFSAALFLFGSKPPEYPPPCTVWTQVSRGDAAFAYNTKTFNQNSRESRNNFAFESLQTLSRGDVS